MKRGKMILGYIGLAVLFVIVGMAWCKWNFR